ncbi:DUF2771 family protein [Saccharopolyspora erythraea]|uniref:DUF2771 family protein n=1 Tax=Saccharopolyspora erythraea TaxID=1836 RepID=UPI001BABC5D9|nr:DUF2771 family protein [Saccharopolyspora erythraea]QUG99941.1 DUF2771 family protein [Saccharopolyspora erythraea]
MFRGLKPLLLAGTAVALAGCSAPADPQVTFYSHGQAVEVAPAQYCDALGEKCSPPPAEPIGKLRVPGREPLQISVPSDVAEAPWQVAFIYRTTSGEEVGGKTEVFTGGDRHAYTLQLPGDGVQFEHVEVQRFSALLSPGTEGGVDFVIGGSWILDVNP